MTSKISRKATSPATRRRFLKGALAGAAGATAAVAMPNVSRAETVTFKMQGSWGAKDIFNEMAQDYVNIVNSMSGGRLKIDYLVGGAVVKPFEVQNATDKGVIDRSEEHTSELQSLMRISYAVFCLKQKTTKRTFRRKQS